MTYSKANLLFFLVFLSSINMKAQQISNDDSTSLDPYMISSDLHKYYKNGSVDSIHVEITMFKNQFNHIDSTQKFYVITDTIFDSSNVYSVGLRIIDPFLEFHNQLVGEWKSFYSNGQLKSIGNYSLGVITRCQSGGPLISGYSLKSGEWKFYHLNGQLEAKGKYIHYLKNIDNNCGGDAYYLPNTDSNWQFWENNGNQISKPKEY